MPGISTHVHCAQLILPQLDMNYDPCHFVLGAIAPDSFDRSDSDSFHCYHFTRGDAESDLRRFQRITRQSRQEGSLNQLSFVDGYYAHLWLDNFVRAHQDRLPIRNPAELIGEELQKAVRANVEQYSLAAIRDFLEAMKMPPSEMNAVPGLEFVSIGQVTEMLQHLQGATQELDRKKVEELVVDEAEYSRFLSEAADSFVAMWDDIR